MFPTAKDFVQPVSVTIKAGAALSDAVDIRRYPNAGYVLAGAWTAASLGFKVSLDGVNFYPLRNAAGALVEMASVGASEGRSLPSDVAPFQYVKLWSETAGSDVNQAADRVFTVGTKG